MLTTTLAIRNDETGELETKTFKEVGPQKPSNRDFLMMHQPELKQLVKRDLTPAALRVFLYLIAECNWGNKVVVQRTVLYRDLNITRQTYRRALDELLSNNDVKADDSGEHVLWLDPAVCFKGVDRARLAAETRWKSGDKW